MMKSSRDLDEQYYTQTGRYNILIKLATRLGIKMVFIYRKYCRCLNVFDLGKNIIIHPVVIRFTDNV